MIEEIENHHQQVFFLPSLVYAHQTFVEVFQNQQKNGDIHSFSLIDIKRKSASKDLAWKYRLQIQHLPTTTKKKTT